MSVCVVGDATLVEAFALVGVSGYVLNAGDRPASVIARLAQHGARLVLLQARHASEVSDDQLDQLARQQGCLVLAVPGVGEAPTDPDSLRRAVRAAIGAT